MLRKDGWVGPARAPCASPTSTPSRPTPSRDWPARGADKVRAGVTGRCDGAQRALWEAGLVFDATPGLLLASRPFGRLDRYLAASYGMF